MTFFSKEVFTVRTMCLIKEVMCFAEARHMQI